MDATMEVLRLASSERHEVDRVQGGDASAAAAADGSPQQQKQQHDDSKESTWPIGAPVPSRERLLTLLWAIKVEERRIQIRDRITATEKEPGRPSVSETTTPTNHQKYVLLKIGSKRARETDHYRYQGRTSLKRRSL
jgi:transcriptional activator HAC1